MPVSGDEGLDELDPQAHVDVTMARQTKDRAIRAGRRIRLMIPQLTLN
jgi:hypothetical protein